MQDLSSLKGAITALITPMRSADNEVDYEAVKNLLRHQLVSNIDAIVIGGSTGESPTLTSEEFEQLIRTSVTFIESNFNLMRVPVIAGTGTSSTASTIEKTKLARDAGAAGALVVCPPYNKPSQDGLYEHFKAIANAVHPFPLIVYNVPGRTACDLKPETAARLAQIDNIVGIKEASGSLERIAELVNKCPKTFNIYSGDDDIAVQSILNHPGRVQGVISVTSNACPWLVREAVIAAWHQKVDRAVALDSAAHALHKAMFVEANPVPSKWLMAHLKYCEGGIRLPLLPLSECHHDFVLKTFEQTMAAADKVASTIAG